MFCVVLFNEIVCTLTKVQYMDTRSFQNFVQFTALWATRQTEETKGNRELHVKTTLRELIIYLVFLIILCVGKEIKNPKGGTRIYPWSNFTNSTNKIYWCALNPYTVGFFSLQYFKIFDNVMILGCSQYWFLYLKMQSLYIFHKPHT